MKRIVLPGTGTPTVLTVAEDSTVDVLAGGRLITVSLTANVPTRIEYVNSYSALGLVA
jgi:hypothetical protein